VEAMEAESPGFYQRHLDDLLRYTDPKTGLNGAQVYFNGIGLDIDRYEDYLNIDKLAQVNGVVTPAELEAIPEADREAYKLLPSSLRRDWASIESDEQKWHLGAAKNQLRAEAAEKEAEQFKQQQAQAFQAKLRQDIQTDLSTLRKEGMTSLRDSLTKAMKLSSQEAVNEDYIDAVITPFALLLTEDFRELGEHMLERAGVKLDRMFYEDVLTLTAAREQYKIAEAYGAEADMQDSLKTANGKLAKIMAKFNDIGIARAKSFGQRASQIATANGNALAAANTRPMPPNGTAVEGAQGILPPGMDPYSPQAIQHLWNQSQQARR
jgi:hypothetical protein